MKNLQKGFIAPVLLVIIALLVVGGGVYIYKNNKPETVVDTGTQQTNTQTPPVTTQQNPTNNKPVNTVPTTVTEIPNIIKNITTDAQTGSQKPENNSLVIDQVRKDVQNGKLLWFKDPVEVSKKYGNRFGIGASAQYVLEQKATMGEYSGLWHSTVLATYNSKSYRIYLIAEPSQPLILGNQCG